MIKRLNNHSPAVAEKIYSVFQASYAVEAELLQANDFPPLKRTVNDFLTSHTLFYGFWQEDDLTAVVEVRTSEDNTHLQSLVVHPDYFRQGIGRQLTTFVLESFNTQTFTVETGAANHPARALYEKLGFKFICEWDTDHGIRKVRFIKKEG